MSNINLTHQKINIHARFLLDVDIGWYLNVTMCVRPYIRNPLK